MNEVFHSRQCNSQIRVNLRVATDLENLENMEKSGNLKETSESQGICDRIPKVREFCCVKFIYSQVEDPNFENSLAEHAPRPHYMVSDSP